MTAKDYLIQFDLLNITLRHTSQYVGGISSGDKSSFLSSMCNCKNRKLIINEII